MRDPAEILTATKESFVAKLKVVPDFKLPKQRIILTGELAHDMEMLVIHTQIGPYQGMPGQAISGYQAASGGFTAISMDFNVSLVREIYKLDNAGRAPSMLQFQENTLMTATDGRVLTEAFYAVMADNSIASACDVAAFGGVRWIGPNGGMIETRLTFSLQL